MRHLSLIIPCLLAVILLVAIGCGSRSANTTNETPNPSASESPRVIEATQDGTSVRTFAHELFRASAPSSANFALSPLSAASALAMATEGARETTQSEMLRTLHHGDAHDGARLIRLTQDYANEPNITIHAANRLFGDGHYAFAPAFLTRLENAYASPLETVDFAGAPDPARTRINAWVLEQTQQRISDLLSPGSITNLTRLVLVNALYFRGTWANAFNPEQTQPLPFTTPNGAITVDMMHRSGTAKVYLTDALQVLDLPYSNPRFAMSFVVPNDAAAFTEALRNGDALSDAIARVSETERVEVYLPKFRLDGAGFSLSGALQSLGMTTAFTDRADFSGMMQPGQAPLSISDVVQKVFVEVNEEGAEAAAATAVIMVMRGGPAMRPATFRADKPFYFVLRDTTLNLPLFVGYVATPTASSAAQAPAPAEPQAAPRGRRRG